MADRPLPTVDCAHFDASVAEMALEILDSGERDALLAHAATCPRCAGELQRMAAAADRLTLLAPDCEPPVGFEQRVMESLASQPSQKPRRLRPVHPVRVWHLAAAAVVLLAVGLVVGLAAHRASAPVAGPDSSSVRYADLVDSGGAHHGSVTLVADQEPNATVMLTMSLVDLGAGEYHCVVHLEDGTTSDVASWPIDDDRAGIWAVPVSATLDQIRGVSVRDEDGSTIAMTDWLR